jgi:four helix bundle protein
VGLGYTQDTMQSHKDLIVWQKSIDLVVLVYELTDKFSKSEQYGLTSQMRRAAVSIPSNIAEGYTRKHRKEYLQFLSVSDASASELETQLIIAKRLGFADEKNIEVVQVKLDEVMRMLNGLIVSLSPQPTTLNPQPYL